MASDTDRNFRRLMKKYRVVFKPPSASDQWPVEHFNRFDSIRKIRDQRLDTFCPPIDILSEEKPWKERTKTQAKWLAKRASHLFNQQRNEAGWRLGLENDVLRRLTVEVACPKCRARIWHSEIKACASENGDVATRLEERRRERKSCTCPPKDRPQDFYEIGTNTLFDDRAQEVVIHDLLLRSELPPKEPDRVYGLQATKNFEKLLSTSIESPSNGDDQTTLRDVVRSSPFKDSAEPLLFPFLILEAKSDKSAFGFDDIQNQTAFPIMSLLKLQHDLYSQVPGGNSNGPLLWFFANRGDAWRVYGCCVTEGESTKYEIFQLWDGSILCEDNALQLLLIVDYIIDWARDIYRPAILRHLKALVTSDPYDKVSLTADSDIFSVYPHKQTLDWLQDTELDFNQPTAALDHQSLLKTPIPNTILGTLRSCSLIKSRAAGIYLTEHNVRPLLEYAVAETAARKIINFITQWDEIFLLTGEDLCNMEERWTGEVRALDEISIDTRISQFYVILECRNFIDVAWNIVREINYLAVSKKAFEIMVELANFKIKHPGILSISRTARSCPSDIFNEGIRCLSSGTPSQIFKAAISCTSFSIYQLPERKRADHTFATEALGFGHVDRPRLLETIQQLHNLCQKKRRKGLVFLLPELQLTKARRRVLTARQKLIDNPLDIGGLSFIRTLDTTLNILENQPHDAAECSRCCQSHRLGENMHYLPTLDEAPFLAYGMAPVISLSEVKHSDNRHDICVFVLDSNPEIDTDLALSTAIEDLLQSGSVYHTILHQPMPRNTTIAIPKDDFMWNLPLTYHSSTPQEKRHFERWIRELKGQPVTDEVQPRTDFSWSSWDYWDALQRFYYLLRRGKPAEEAMATSQATEFDEELRRRIGREMKEEEEERERKQRARLEALPWSHLMLSFRTIPVKGDREDESKNCDLDIS